MEIRGILSRVLCKLVGMLDIAYVTLQIQKYTRNIRNFTTIFRFQKERFQQDFKEGCTRFKWSCGPLAEGFALMYVCAWLLYYYQKLCFSVCMQYRVESGSICICKFITFSAKIS